MTPAVLYKRPTTRKVRYLTFQRTSASGRPRTTATGLGSERTNPSTAAGTCSAARALPRLGARNGIYGSQGLLGAAAEHDGRHSRAFTGFEFGPARLGRPSPLA